MKDLFGSLLVIFGLMVMAGSANDCDGKCMEYANTIGETAQNIIFGLTIAAIGGIIVYNQNKI